MIREIPSPIVTTVDTSKLVFELGAAQSRAGATRLVKQGAVKINGEVAGRFADICHGDVIQCGKRFFRRLMNEDTMKVEIT